jgi:hypothetical protein
MVREGALKVFCQAALLVDMVGLLLMGSDVEWTMGEMLRWLRSCISNRSRDFVFENTPWRRKQSLVYMSVFCTTVHVPVPSQISTFGLPTISIVSIIRKEVSAVSSAVRMCETE